MNGPELRATLRQLKTDSWGRLGLPGLGARRISGEIAAGFLGSLVSIAYCVSFSALIFGGALGAGLPLGLWSFLAATALATLLISVTTTLPPGIAGPRNPTVAVMSVLVAGIAGSVLARGGSPDVAVASALAGMVLATALTGAVLLALGTLRLGQAVRFVPYPVIAGFLAASGWLLIAGGLKVAYSMGPAPAGEMAGISGPGVLRVALAIGFFGAVEVARRTGAGGVVLPLAFFGSAIVLDLALWTVGSPAGWHVAGADRAMAWSPLLPAFGSIDLGAIAAHAVEIGAIAGVAVITLLLDVSGLEAQREATADLDAEFRWNGIANLAIAPLGGASVALAPNSSRLIEEGGGLTRLSGVAGGLLVLGVIVAGIDIAALLPTPVLGGLLILLGATILRDVLRASPAGGSRLDIALAVLIMLSIVQFGYLPGVVLGLVAACIAFAFRYSRIGIIRRHLTRAAFAAPMERPAEDRDVLVAEGGRIHVFWVSGFVFFGSASGVFDAIRQAVGESDAAGRRRWVILDLSGVTGLDSSALLSFSKLATWARRFNVTLIWAAVPPEMRERFAAQGLSDRNGAPAAMATRGEALERCEEELLAEASGQIREQSFGSFVEWLARELGAETAGCLIDRHFTRRDLEAGELLCRQGEAADSIDLIVSGTAAVVFHDATGRDIRLRRMTGRTVIGEMGFFRHQQRTTSVVAETPVALLTMSRTAYETMLEESPPDATRFLEFIVRQLADRVEFANKEIAALA
jgi:sulfate permease, SulP family